MRRVSLAFLLCIASPAAAEPLTITKTATIVADPLGNALPRSLPGATADFRTRATNPLANLLKPVRNLVLEEPLPTHVVLRVTDWSPGRGPIEFTDGNLLGTGLASSGLSLSYSAANPATDGVEFSNGTTWTYQPVADADGYDVNVRAIRVRLAGTFSASTSFQLRYRVRIR